MRYIEEVPPLSCFFVVIPVKAGIQSSHIITCDNSLHANGHFDTIAAHTDLKVKSLVFLVK